MHCEAQRVLAQPYVRPAIKKAHSDFLFLFFSWWKELNQQVIGAYLADLPPIPQPLCVLPSLPN